MTQKTSLQHFTIFRNLYVYLLLVFLHWNATILSACHLYVYNISTVGVMLMSVLWLRIWSPKGLPLVFCVLFCITEVFIKTKTHYMPFRLSQIGIFMYFHQIHYVYLSSYTAFLVMRSPPPPPASQALMFCFSKDILVSSKTTADIDAKLSVPYWAVIWRLPAQCQKNPFGCFWENGVLVTSCFTISGRKTANVWKPLECTGLEQNATQKRHKM